MKRSILCLLLVLSLVPHRAWAAERLEFSSRIQDEALAEEAIDLLRCLSERLTLPWELLEGGKGSHRLHLEEKAGALHGRFSSPEGEKRFTLPPAGASTICEELAPKPEKELEMALEESALPPPEKKSAWLWWGAALGVALGGFLFWKSRQPDHRGLRMN